MQLQKLIPFVSNGLINAASQLLQSLSLVLISLVVIPTQGIEFWGKFISIILLPGLLIQLISGGNTSYLLRKFSLYPQQLNQEWQENYTTRLIVYVVLAIGLLSLILIETSVKFSIFFWATGNFLYQPFLVLIIFNRKFIFSLFLEIAILVPTLAYIYVNKLSISELLITIGISFYVKTILGCFLFREIVFNRIKVVWRPYIFIETLPFFALSLIGVLASRVGLYIAVFLLPDRELGIYQLLNSLFSNLQVMAFFFIQPSIKNMYRMTTRKIKVMASKIFLFGLIFLLFGTAAIWCVLELYFKLNISFNFLIAGILWLCLITTMQFI